MNNFGPIPERTSRVVCGCGALNVRWRKEIHRIMTYLTPSILYNLDGHPRCVYNVYIKALFTLILSSTGKAF